MRMRELDFLTLLTLGFPEKSFTTCCQDDGKYMYMEFPPSQLLFCLIPTESTYYTVEGRD